MKWNETEADLNMIVAMILFAIAMVLWPIRDLKLGGSSVRSDD